MADQVIDGRMEPFIRMETEDARVAAAALEAFADATAEEANDAVSVTGTAAADVACAVRLAEYLNRWAAAWEARS